MNHSLLSEKPSFEKNTFRCARSGATFRNVFEKLPVISGKFERKVASDIKKSLAWANSACGASEWAGSPGRKDLAAVGSDSGEEDRRHSLAAHPLRHAPLQLPPISTAAGATKWPDPVHEPGAVSRTAPLQRTHRP